VPDSNAKVTGDFSSLISGAENAAKSIAKIGAQLTGIAAASKAFDVATSAIGGTVNALGKIGMAAMGIEAIGKSTVSMANGLLKGNAALEMTTISFKTLLGSAKAADDMIKQLTTFAANTPFNLPGLEASTQRLLAAGYAAQDIVPMMTALGDSISALGGTQDQLNSLVYVFGQMRNEAKLNAGDIAQMSNLGIPALQMLADHYHKTTSQIQEMITKGLIPGKDAAAIFATEMERKYGGMMQAQSKTFSGMISNLQDWATATMITLTKPFFAPAEKGLQHLLEVLQSPAGEAAVNKLAADIQHGVDVATKAFIQFEPKIKPTFDRLLQIAEAVHGRFTPGILTLIPLLEKLWNRFEPLGLTIWKTYQSIQPLNIALAALRGLAEGGVAGALAVLKDRFDKLVTVGQTLLTKLSEVLSKVFTWIIQQAPVILDKLKTWATAFVDWVIHIAGNLLQKLGAALQVILNWVQVHATEILDQLATWGQALASWILPMIPRIIESLTGVLNQIILWVATKAPTVLTALLKWGLQFVNWIKPQIALIMASLRDLISVNYSPGRPLLSSGLTR
jgi:tape measure domain-containing protein